MTKKNLWTESNVQNKKEDFSTEEKQKVILNKIKKA